MSSESESFIAEFIGTNNLAIKKVYVAGFAAYQAEIDSLLAILSFIKTTPNLRFTLLTDLFAVDFPERQKRFEVVYSLLSLKLNQRLLIKLLVTESDHIPSVVKLFSAACWYEREVYDMFGINFTDTHDLRRILTDYSFIGHPLRKDFPLTGHLQVRYDDALKKVIYEPVKLEQEFREFDFTSPWQGKDGMLPGDEKAVTPLNLKPTKVTPG